jgi:hypothetical protein
MEKWTVPPHMAKLSMKTTQTFGYDHQGIITYKFNNLGFRTEANLYNSGAIILVGNSIAFGIGIDYYQTFGGILAKNLKRKLNNFSYGCYLHENHDHLTNIQLLATQDNDDLFIIQINNLDRCRVNPELVVTGNDPKFCKIKFLDYFDQVTHLLKNRKKIFIYWDTHLYDLPKSVVDQILIFNKFHLDTSLSDNPGTFGIKSNLAIATALEASITKAGIIP